MKRFIIMLSVVLTAGMAVAQSETVESLAEKVTALENKINNQATLLNQLQASVDEVTKQNLALKNAVKLTPTKAKAKLGQNIEFRIIELTGDKSTGTLNIVMTAEDLSGMNSKVFFTSNPEAIDELGNKYVNGSFGHIITGTIRGSSQSNIFPRIIELKSDSPYILDIKIKNYNKNAQYLKYFEISGEKESIIFKNLPIKWVEEE